MTQPNRLNDSIHPNLSKVRAAYIFDKANLLYKSSPISRNLLHSFIFYISNLIIYLLHMIIFSTSTDLKHRLDNWKHAYGHIRYIVDDNSIYYCNVDLNDMQ